MNSTDLTVVHHGHPTPPAHRSPDRRNLDVVGTMDYLNNHGQAYLSKLPTVQHLAKAPILTWYFVSDTLDPTTATSGPYAVCPVDCILVPGIDPFGGRKRVREKEMSRSEHPLVDNLHWLSSPCTNRCPGLVQVASNKNGAENGDRRREGVH